MVILDYGCGSDVGCVRELNEDSYYANTELGLWLIADGMGGYEGGNVASLIVSETVVKAVRDGRSLSEAIQLAHGAVLSASSEGRGPPRMGSTIVALRGLNERYEVAWVGDSRAYLWDGRLGQISRDHSYVQTLVDRGDITKEQARTHLQSNVVTQALGAGGQQIRVDCVSGRWLIGQKILLCSDGLNGELSDDQISQILMSEGPDQHLVDSLIDAALQQGGRDNVSVMVISAPANTQPKMLGRVFPRFSLRRRRHLLRIVLVTLLLVLLGLMVACAAPSRAAHHPAVDLTAASLHRQSPIAGLSSLANVAISVAWRDSDG
ncbi:MAG: protein phosphatase 2C domain-containing protein [Motiliproteus sp.]